MTLGARLVMSANSVIAGVIVARLLGAESLGIYVVLTAAVQILIQTSGFALHLGNTYFTAQRRQLLPRVAANSLLFAVLSGGGCIAVALILSDRILPGVPFRLALIGLLSVPFQLVTAYSLNLFLAVGDFKRFNFIDLANQSFVLINALAAIVLVGGGLELLVPLNTAAALAIAIVSAAMVVHNHRPPEDEKESWRIDVELLRKVLGYSSKGFILWLSIFLVYRFDLILVNYFNGTADAAVYAVATQYTLFLLLLPHVVSQLLQARVSATRDEGGEFTSRASRVTAALMFVACIASIPAAYILAKIYGNGFERLPMMIFILLPGVLFVGIQSVLAQYFLGTGMPIKIVVIWLATVAVNVAANLIIIARYGPFGAAFVSSATYIGVSIAMMAVFTRSTKRSLGAVLITSISELRSLVPAGSRTRIN